MSQLTPQEQQALIECSEAITVAQAKLVELSEDWRIHKGILTMRELDIAKQKTIIAMLRQRIAEIDPHYGFDTQGTVNE